jgi:hypothetical protein
VGRDDLGRPELHLHAVVARHLPGHRDRDRRRRVQSHRRRARGRPAAR